MCGKNLHRLVPHNVYTMGLVAGTSPLKGLHVGTVSSKIAKFRAYGNSPKREDKKWSGPQQ